MPIEHAKRLAWFRQLQQIMRFPRTFLAPQYPGLRRHPRVTDAFAPLGSNALREAPGPSATAEPRRKVLSHGQTPRVALQRTIRSPIAVRLPVVPADLIGTSRILRSPKVAEAATRALARPAGRSGAQSLKVSGQATAKAVPRQPPLQQLGLGASSLDKLRSPTHPLALSQPLKGLVLDSHLGRTSGHLAIDQMLRAQPPVDNRTDDDEQFAGGKSRPDPYIPDNAVRDKSESRATGSASTVHIDGSVMGRWAIQHLERVLGRPPIGMTGIDPRASAPRSRVSPF
jgi:hypothetical protein